MGCGASSNPTEDAQESWRGKSGRIDGPEPFQADQASWKQKSGRTSGPEGYQFGDIARSLKLKMTAHHLLTPEEQAIAAMERQTYTSHKLFSVHDAASEQLEEEEEVPTLGALKASWKKSAGRDQGGEGYQFGDIFLTVARKFNRLMDARVKEEKEVIEACRHVKCFGEPDEDLINEVHMSYLYGGASALAIVRVEHLSSEDSPQLVVRLNNPSDAASNSAHAADVVGDAAAELGVAPRKFFSGSLNSGQSVEVMEFVTGGCPDPRFLADSLQDCRNYGELLGALHRVPPAVIEGLPGVCHIAPETEAILRSELALDDEQLQGMSALGTFPGRFSQILLLRMHGAPKAFLSRLAAVIKAVVCGAGQWLQSDMCTRLVVGHGDVSPQNLLRRSDGRLVAIDFESARMMHWAIDVGSLLIMPGKKGLMAHTVTYAHRKEIAMAYIAASTGASGSLSQSQVDGIDTVLWDMEVGMCVRLAYVALTAPFCSGSFALDFVILLERAVNSMTQAQNNSEIKAAIIKHGTISYLQSN